MNHNNNHITQLIESVATMVDKADYDSALSAYVSVFKQSPEFLSPKNKEPLTKSRATHIHNAANLSCRALYSARHHIASTSRIKHAVNMLLGVERKVYQHKAQKPSFLFIADLLHSLPFSEISEVDGLQDLVYKLSSSKEAFPSCVKHANDNYVHKIGEVPKSDNWKRSSDNWSSMHLTKVEKQDIQMLMREYANWSAHFGALAVLDKRFY